MGRAPSNIQKLVETFEWEIKYTDDQIDQLVYELYGLTDKEIKIVEEATAG